MKTRVTIRHIQHESGYAFVAYTGTPFLSSHIKPSKALILEDGIPLSEGGAPHEEIRQKGSGRYSFWHDQVYFSSSDRSNPCTNGKHYEFEYNWLDYIPYLHEIKYFFYRIFLRSTRTSSSLGDTPVNFGKRKADKKTLINDLNYTVQVAQNYINLLPNQKESLFGKTVLEIGPGINFGTALFMSAFGAKVSVSDLYLSQWNDEYHPRFYRLLRRWLRKNISGADLSTLDLILDRGGYPSEAVKTYATPLELLSGIEDKSIDFIFSNAVFEHLENPEQAFFHLARVSKPGAKGYHQVDFRDHRNSLQPLEFLLIEDEAFAREFKKDYGERGNRYRPSEYWSLLESNGFSVDRYIPSSTADVGYLNEFIPRLRLANGSRFQFFPAEQLEQISGCFCLTKR
jgi:SAM-dependent methyltransferase